MNEASESPTERVLFIAEDDNVYHGIADLLADRRDVDLSPLRGVAEEGTVRVRENVIRVLLWRRMRRDERRQPVSSVSFVVSLSVKKGLLGTSYSIELGVPPASSEIAEKTIASIESCIQKMSLLRRHGGAPGEVIGYHFSMSQHEELLGLDRIEFDLWGTMFTKTGLGNVSRFASVVAQLAIDGYALHLERARAVRPAPAPAPTVAHRPPTVSGFISQLAISHVKTLPPFAWDLPAKRAGWHVVLGTNASGKTALLRAIAAALLPADELGALRQDWSRWVTAGSSRASASLTIGDARLAWTISAGSFTREGHDFDGFSAAYGPFRRFTGGDSEYQREFSAHARLLRHLSLFSERVALSAALDWLKDLEFRRVKNMPEGALIDSVQRFINETGLLPDGVRLERIDPNGVWFRDANGAEIPADEMSDGYRAVLSLALDLVRHLSVGRTPADLFAETDGRLTVRPEAIVLIDEIDAHLHPTWQQRIGPWFVERFPNAQFIVATHSAIVCQAADSVLLLPTPGTGDAPRVLDDVELSRLRYGSLLDAYGTGVFGEGVTRSEASRAMLARLAELNVRELEGPLSDAERAEQVELRAVLPSTAFAETTEDAAS